MEFPIQFWHPSDEQALLIMGDYNLWLVLLSLLVAIFAAYMAFFIVGQAQRAHQNITKRAMLLAGGFGLGGGIWAMHFIGMLACPLHTNVSYDLTLTLISLIPSIAASWFTLSLLMHHPIAVLRLFEGGIILGTGIAIMHQTGISAMQFDAAIRYDMTLFTIALMIGIAFSTLSLWVYFRQTRWRKTLGNTAHLLLSSILIGVATAGMHYSNMSALRLVALPHQDMPLENMPPEYLGIMIALITLIAILLIVATSGLMRYRDMLDHLRINETRFRSVIDTAVTGIVITDLRGHIQQFNRAAEEIFGWSADEIIGKNVNRLTLMPVQLSRMVYMLHHDEPLRADRTWVIQGIRRSGKTFPLQLSVGHMQIPGEELFVGFVEDISKRHQVEIALRDNEQQFRSLISNMPGVSYRALPEDNRPLVFVSDAVIELTGYPSFDFLNKREELNFNALIHPDDWDRVQEAIADGVWARQPYTVEYRLRNRDGEYHWVWEHGSSVFDDRGQLVWLDGVIFDISERHAMEQALVEAKNRAEQAAAAKTAFLANMSHEIRTPMNAIIGFTDVVLTSDLQPQQRQHLETIRQSAKSLLRLLNDILDTAKMERGSIELEEIDFSLSDLLQELTQSLEIGARNKGLQLILQQAPNLPPYLKGDPLRIRQVLTNLIGNAIKFTEHGQVILSITQEQDQLHFNIQDTGIGIASERLERIFEPFTQADASVTRRYGGTGLGTTICKQLVELMGGKIWLDSLVGVGTHFHVLLPIVIGEAPAVLTPQTAVTLPALNILVADDVQQNLDLLALILRERGHKITLAHDGHEAVDLAREREFDLILMDVQMPGMDGLTATRQIRQYEQENHQPPIPVIALTASVFQDDRFAARDAGMDGFASKPIDIEKLQLEIAQVLGLELSPLTLSSSSSASSQAVDETPLIPGLHYRQGLKLWGQPQAYRQALLRFANEYQTSLEQLQQTFANAEQGRYYAHKLKGVCNNLALKQLAALAQKLESYCLLHEEITPALLERLAEGLNKTTQALQIWGQNKSIEVSNNENSNESPLDISALLKAALELKQALKHGELNDEALQLLAKQLPKKELHPEWITLRNALDSFEFDEALQALERLYQPYQTKGANA